MEHYKISKLLSDSAVSKFVSKKLIEVNDLSGGQYSANKNIKFKTRMLRSYLYVYSEPYIIVILLHVYNKAKRRNKKNNE